MSARRTRRWCRWLLEYLGQGLYWAGAALGGYIAVPWDAGPDSTPDDVELTELERWWRLETRNPR